MRKGLTWLVCLIFGSLLALIVYCWALDQILSDHHTKIVKESNNQATYRMGQICIEADCERAVILVGNIDADFQTMVRQLAASKFEGVAWVCLRSPGGDIGIAMESASLIAKQKMNTCVVPVEPGVKEPNSPCASSCLYIFAAGERRVIDKTSVLGIHPSLIGVEKCYLPCNFAQRMTGETKTWLAADKHGLGQHPLINRLNAETHAHEPTSILRPTDFHTVTPSEYIEWGLATQKDLIDNGRFVLDESKKSP